MSAEPADRAMLRLCSVMEEFEDHLSNAVMSGFALGQEEPIWIDAWNDEEPKRGAHLLVLGHDGKRSIIEGYRKAKHEGSFSHYILIPANPQ